MAKQFKERICRQCLGRFQTFENDRHTCKSCELKIKKAKKIRQSPKTKMIECDKCSRTHRTKIYYPDGWYNLLCTDCRKERKGLPRYRRGLPTKKRGARYTPQQKYIRRVCDHIIDNISRIKTEKKRREKYIPILNARLIEGKSLQEVGDQFGCTRERVRQICNKYARKYGFEETKIKVTRKKYPKRKTKVVAHGERTYHGWKGKPTNLISGLYGMFDFVNSEILRANRDELIEIAKKYSEFRGAKEALEEREEFTIKFVRPLMSGTDTEVENVRNLLYEIQCHLKGRLEDIMRITREFETYKKRIKEILEKPPEEVTEEEEAEIASLLLKYVRNNHDPFLREKFIAEVDLYEKIPENQRTMRDFDKVKNALIEHQKDIRSLLFLDEISPTQEY